MSCDDEADPGLEPRIAELFLELEMVGMELLHPIEREIHASLLLRPRRVWCHAQLKLLEGLVLKAKGLPLDSLFAQE